MKVLEFNYKTSPEMRKFAFDVDSDGDKLLNDIVKARSNGTKTLIINGQKQSMLISPCEILELVLKEITELESTNGI